MQSLAPILRFVLAERGWPGSDRLEWMAEHLPAVATAGLEVSLAGDGAIDLQQRIQGQEEIARLTRWIDRTQPQGKAWQRLAAALPMIADDVLEYWLELDAPAEEASAAPPLSVFVKLGDPSSAAVARVLEGFDIRLPPARLEALQRCLAACEPDARLSHLGFMLGRGGAPLRLIVEGVPPDGIHALLTRSGWPGPINSTVARIDRLFAHADRIRLALTLADGLTPDIGLECFVGEPAANDPRWRSLFDTLVEEDLCTPVRRDQMLAWPARLTPLSSRHWPEALITDALLRAEAGSRWLDCRISHVKVTIAPGQQAPAKGYFGFIDVHSPAALEREPPLRTATAEAHAALEAATAFLIAARNQAGWWLDYDGFSEGPADEWVTAYIAHMLYCGGDPDGRAAALRAWHLLKARVRHGWGWNFLQPADADSTIWGLRLASALDRGDTPEASEATEFLRRHMQEGGGFATYRRDVYAGWSDGKAVNPAWYDAHGCVTAAAAHVPGVGPEALAHLRAIQGMDGGWQGYWWESDRYATALAAEALAAQGGAGDEDRVRRAVAATTAWLEAPGGAADWLHERPFEAACALRALLLRPLDGGGHIERLVDGLLATQRVDGSWCASAALAIPNRQGDIVQAIDNRRCFTTATVLDALGCFERWKRAGR
ncbi:prenyltransferase/squalene oxidase repeat-containing protein [Sphingomonas sp. Root50]|uniref:prenyltransferase/squalene oxidase repeat-containing protein n=1 Tax=Sphingomonas sp. Root50 TaxID=1736551 RepID=UPI0006FAE0CB|nr:prenyltransferase/squalene oxidase repeat-containing protein [Sphingomonas sp. Root50]